MWFYMVFAMDYIGTYYAMCCSINDIYYELHTEIYTNYGIHVKLIDNLCGFVVQFMVQWIVLNHIIYIQIHRIYVVRMWDI